MRLLALSLTLAASAALAACASTNEQRASNRTTANTTATTSSAPPAQTTGTPAAEEYRTSPIAPAHRSGGGNNNAATAASNSSNGEATGIDTSAQDAKIAQLEGKAKATNASQADKLAAASAYMERADVFMQAGRPALYKYALRDYRRTLRYQPDNRQAQDSINTIVGIYKQLNRPVPELGNEP